jgi:hypothetical protein
LIKGKKELQMVKKHFLKRWRERLESRNIPKELLNKLMIRCYKLVETNYGQDEMICLIDFNKYGFNFYENELWINIRGNSLVTLYRRNKNVPTTIYGSRVDNVSYVWNW